MVIQETTLKPTIINNRGNYVIVGSVDHGMQIPESSILELIVSLNNVQALIMETPEIFHSQWHPMSTEILTKVSVGNSPISYLPGNGLDEEIGEFVLKYAPRNISEVFVPCLYVRNSCQLGQLPSIGSMSEFIKHYQKRFKFLDEKRAMKNYIRLLQFWNDQGLDPMDLNDFSYDFEKFVGDIREFEFWQPELREFRQKYSGKIAACVGDYHVPFVKDVFDGREVKAPDWETHIDTKREDKLTPQDSTYLKELYNNLEKALE